MTRLPLRPRSLAVALVATLALAACGGGDDSDSGSDGTSASASPTAEAASGDEAGTDEYTFTAPEGWTDITDRIPGFSPEVAYSSPDPVDGFATNLNVLPEPGLGQGRSAGEVVEATVPQLEATGFREVEQRDPFEVDGKEAGVVTAAASQNDVTYRTRQYFLTGDDHGWIVTFSFPEGTSDADQAELAESVMTTWSFR